MNRSAIVADGFDEVAHEFERNFTEHGELGASFVVVQDGQIVVDLHGGAADAHRPWGPETLGVLFSGTKGLIATCLLVLIDRGSLDLQQPVYFYWPEFAAENKQDILVRHIVSHTAGMPGLRVPVQVNEIRDFDAMTALLEAQRPFWPAGSQLCYHSLTFGWLCGELVRRIDGRTVGQFFADEIARPLELEVWIGLPHEMESRVCTLTRRDDTPPASHFLCDEDVVWAAKANPPLHVGEPTFWNDPATHAAEIPAVNGIGTARSMARLYGCLASGGELDGARLVSAATVEQGRACLSRAPDACSGWPFAFGTGFSLQTDAHEFGPPVTAFGHSGAGGSIHGAWPDDRIGFSYLMNDLRDDQERSDALLRALDRAVHPEGVDVA